MADQAEPARHAAVLGRPIAHSLSPVLHRAAYAELGLDWSYSAIDCGIDDLRSVLAQRPGWAGFSCTMPLKRAAFDIAEEARPRAIAIGAANTLLPRAAGGWAADNTDVVGVSATLGQAGVAPRTATVLGAGGTAQAVLAAFAEMGVDRCAVLARDPARTRELRETAERVHVVVEVAALAVGAPELGADLVVSTLPAGAADPLAGTPWRRGQTLLDVVYDRWPTNLAAAAQAAGADILSGARMLLHQAAAQVELMTGRAAPVAAMRAALRASQPASGV